MNEFNLHGLHIDPRLCQHPTDRAVTDKILHFPAVRKVLETISANSLERVLRSTYLSNYVQLTDKTAPRLMRMVDEAVEMFGLPVRPEIYLTRTYDMRATLMGLETPMLLISSEIIANANEQELWSLVASTLAGVRTGYAEIRLIDWLMQNSMGLLPDLAVQALRELIRQWRKFAQLSFDRLNLMVTADFNVTMCSVLAGETKPEILRRIDFTDPDCGVMCQFRELFARKGFLDTTLRYAETITSGSALYALRCMELEKFWRHEYNDLMEDYAQEVPA